MPWNRNLRGPTACSCIARADGAPTLLYHPSGRPGRPKGSQPISRNEDPSEETRRTTLWSVVWRSNSATDPFHAGCLIPGAISASGTSTNRRRCIRGCGTCNSGVSIVSCPYSRMSISISRGPFATNFLLPIFVSISRKARNSVIALKCVSASTAQFKNHRCSRKSTGSGSYNDDTFVTPTPPCGNSPLAPPRFLAPSPTFAPTHQHTLFSPPPFHPSHL